MQRLPVAAWAAVIVGIFQVTRLQAADSNASFPVVPGYHVLKDSGKVDAAAQGELLIQELSCVACHTGGPTGRMKGKDGPDLSGVAARITPQYLKRFLNDPHGTKPGTTMPDPLHDLTDAQKAPIVESLCQFLWSLEIPATSIPAASIPELLKQGEQLYSNVGCAACHAPVGKAVAMKVPSVPLGDLAEKTTVGALTEFLLDPARVRPAGRMPAMGLSAQEARAIATYLLRVQTAGKSATTRPVPGTGLQVEYFEEKLTTADPSVFEKLTPKAKAKVKTFTLEFAGRKAKDFFALKFHGWIWIPQSGRYTFTLKSDDGSILNIDGKTVVNYDGIHPDRGKAGSVELASGMHPLQLTYFQNGGGSALAVLWNGPGIAEEPVPADVLACESGKAMEPLHPMTVTLDAEKAKQGAARFVSFGCAACHPLKGHPSNVVASALSLLKADSPDSCVSEKVAMGRPRFNVSADQRGAIAAALKNAAVFSTERTPAAEVLHTMAAMNCLACHQRGEVGGVSADRNEQFKLTGQFDVGDEGRLPPRLTGVGAKLQPAAIERIVYERQLHVRWYMATRMPNFSRVALPGLAKLLATADASADLATAAPKTSADDARAGRVLLGVRGYGCVNCHGFNGAKSLGAPSVDLSFAHERLNVGWFHGYLADPQRFNPGTRMPQFWADGNVAIKDIGGNTFDTQSNAIWAFLNKYQDLPLPDGLRLNGSDEIVPGDEPVVLRAFVTGVSPRSILVGNPEGVHFVFDANAVRMAKLWHGRFFDAKGIWESRGGRSEAPMGKDVIDLPGGPSLAVLESMAASWPEANAEQRNIGGRFLGYTLDEKQRPTFRYQTPEYIVEEQAIAHGTGDGSTIERLLKVTASQPVKDLFFLVASGKTIEAKGDRVWLVDGKVTVRQITSAAGRAIPAAHVRDGKSGRKELILPVEFYGNTAAFSINMAW